MSVRNEARYARCAQALDKLKGSFSKLDGVKKDNARKRIAELETSLENLRKHGVESLPTGNPVGTTVHVPKRG